ncbi:MAG: hypothetical protein K0R59_3817 [Sphingobacterium sp.]|jgi:hypothetical protein|nr:hypothetical protein [Sphingobacterium sp.]
MPTFFILTGFQLQKVQKRTDRNRSIYNRIHHGSKDKPDNQEK